VSSDPATTDRIQVISPNATPEEIAAIVAAVGQVLSTRTVVDGAARDDTATEWVHLTRVASRRAGLQRGSWRMSGRVSRRSRA
jgi:hypothetical protein